MTDQPMEPEGINPQEADRLAKLYPDNFEVPGALHAPESTLEPRNPKLAGLRKILAPLEEAAKAAEKIKDFELPPDLSERMAALPKPVTVPAHVASHNQLGRYIAAADKAIAAGRIVADCLRNALAAHPGIFNAAQAQAALDMWDKRIG